jgi:hypothetical protein
MMAAASALLLLAGTAIANAPSGRDRSPRPAGPQNTGPQAPGIALLEPGQAIRDPRVITMERLMKPLTFEVEQARLENVIQFITDMTQADIEPLWVEDKYPEGLRKDTLISMKVENLQALAVIERVLRQATDEFDAGTWQFNELGRLEIGPRSRLNKFRTLKVYDINDLTFSLMDVKKIPSIDLSSIGETGGGGGGGGLFDDEEDDMNVEASSAEVARQLQDLIQTFVETEQWEENGGEAGTIRYFRGALLIRAPDYIHRQIDGYRWWSNRRVDRIVAAQAFPDETAEAKARKAAEERRQRVTAEREQKQRELERRKQERDRNRQR